jgi:hypothetical protein
MADYDRITHLTAILENLSGTIAEGTDYDELRLLSGIVTAAGGTPTPVAGTYARITLLNDWATAVGAAAAATDDYAEVERLRVIADDYTAEDAGGTDYEPIRLLSAIATATTP